jgi:O-antigen/teichoic acid export membrane protein
MTINSAQLWQGRRDKLREILPISEEAFWVFLAQGLVALANLFAVRVLTSWLGPSDYGVLALVLAGVALMASLTFSPLNNAGMRFYHEYKEAGRSTILGVTLLSTYMGTCTLIVLIVGAVLAGVHFAGNGDGRWVVGFGAAILVADTVRSPLAGLLCIARQRMYYALITVLDAWTRPAVALVLFLLIGGATWIALLGYAAAALSVAVLSVVVWLRVEQIEWHARRAFSWPLLGEMWVYGWPFLGTTIAAWFLNLSDRFVLRLFRPNAEVGLYTAAYQVGSAIPQLLGTVLVLVVAPILLQNHARNPHSGQDLGRYVGISVLLLIPFVGAVVLHPTPFLNLLTGHAFRSSSKVVSWVAAGTLLGSLVALVANAFILSKKTKELLTLYLVSGAINVVLNFLLIPFFGALGSAISTFLSFGCLCWLAIWQGRKHMWWPMPHREIYLTMAAMSIAGCANIGLRMYSQSIGWFLPLSAWFCGYGLVIAAFYAFTGTWNDQKLIRLRP